jgi:hypothetical protein
LQESRWDLHRKGEMYWANQWCLQRDLQKSLQELQWGKHQFWGFRNLD